MKLHRKTVSADAAGIPYSVFIHSFIHLFIYLFLFIYEIVIESLK